MAIAGFTQLQLQCQKTDSNMKTKHRRLFGQNNRKASHFFLLSAKQPKYLILCVKKTTQLLTFLLFVLLGSPIPVLAQDNLEIIERYINLALDDQYPNVAAIDRTFQVTLPSLKTNSHCEAQLTFKWRGEIKAGANTLSVICSSPQWQWYVPVNVEIFKEVVVTMEPLSRSHPLEANQLELKRLDISSLRMGYFTDTAQIDGYLLQRTVKAGQVITPYIVKAPALIKRGDWVTIVSGRKGLTVTSSGEALKDGVKGDQIPVKNLRSNTRIRAWVINKGMVATKQDLI
jgi:flagella basal body P-ring formation protein FlgA